MWEMQVLSSQKNNNKGGDEASGSSSSGAEYAGEDRLSAETTEAGPESPQDEHPALRGIQSGKFTDTNCFSIVAFKKKNNSLQSKIIFICLFAVFTFLNVSF